MKTNKYNEIWKQVVGKSFERGTAEEKFYNHLSEISQKSVKKQFAEVIVDQKSDQKCAFAEGIILDPEIREKIEAFFIFGNSPKGEDPLFWLKSFRVDEDFAIKMLSSINAFHNYLPSANVVKKEYSEKKLKAGYSAVVSRLKDEGSFKGSGIDENSTSIAAKKQYKNVYKSGWKSILSKPLFTTLASAAMLTLVVGLGLFFNQNETDHSSLIAKGDGVVEFDLQIFKWVNGAEKKLKSGSFAQENDAILTSYSVKNEKYGVIFSVDGLGAVTVHFPPSGSVDTKLRKNILTRLPNQYILDDAPLYETFFFVASVDKIDVKSLIKKVKKLYKSNGVAITNLLGGYKVKVIALVKKGR